MARRDEGLLDLLMELPWWVSVCVVAAVYVALVFVVPSITFNGIFVKNLAQLAPRFAWMAAAEYGQRATSRKLEKMPLLWR